MLLLTITEFRSNISKYMELAATELVSVKTKFGVFNITPNAEIRTSNPSPSNDPWYDAPENIAKLKEAIQIAHEPNTKYTKLDDFKKEMEQWNKE